MSEGPGFIFWGLFVVCAGVVLAYAAWMVWVERRAPCEERERAPGDRERSG